MNLNVSTAPDWLANSCQVYFGIASFVIVNEEAFFIPQYQIMATHLQLGQEGESMARKHLESNGYQIMESNWRHSRAEVDLIAMDGEVLVFVEVKTRTNLSFGRPETFVTAKKEAFLAEAAAAYMDLIQHDWEIRFDIIAVTCRDGEYELRHFKDAFFPGLK
jgi:putative endonuclease